MLTVAKLNDESNHNAILWIVQKRLKNGEILQFRVESAQSCQILPKNTPSVRLRIAYICIYSPTCTWQVCLTSKCFPAWSEARGLKSARLSHIGYCAWYVGLHYVRPLERSGSRPLHYRTAYPGGNEESEKTKNPSDGFFEPCQRG